MEVQFRRAEVPEEIVDLPSDAKNAESLEISSAIVCS